MISENHIYIIICMKPRHKFSMNKSGLWGYLDAHNKKYDGGSTPGYEG